MLTRLLSLLWALSLVTTAARAQWHFDPPKYEGQECGRVGDEVWTCQKESECARFSSLAKTGHIITCSTQGNSRTICCPKSVNAERIVGSISERKCQEYQDQLCPSSVSRFRTSRTDSRTSDSDLSTFGAYPDEDNDEFTANNETEDEDYPVVGIFNGTVVLAGEHPHSALVGYGLDESRVSWACGGSLISERFVLSAAHCDTSTRGEANWVRLGDLDWKTETDNARPQQFQIVQRFVHQDYNYPGLYNDIILYKLDRDAEFNFYVRPACLHPSLEPRGLATATGWGYVEEQLVLSALMKVDLNFIPTAECKKSQSNDADNLPSGIDGNTMLCAWKQGKDTCRGDSGGPLVLADRGGSCLLKQVGITSFGPARCEGSTTPGVYVRVAAFIPWIEDVVWPEDDSDKTSTGLGSRPPSGY